MTIDNMDGRCNENGLGCVVEVTEKNVTFRARNFAAGKYVPEEDIVIPLQ